MTRALTPARRRVPHPTSEYGFDIRGRAASFWVGGTTRAEGWSLAGEKTQI